jgi:hypothetical protein
MDMPALINGLLESEDYWLRATFGTSCTGIEPDRLHPCAAQDQVRHRSACQAGGSRVRWLEWMVVQT